MTLSKQFLIIITAVFITVFTTNFLITMQNTKEYIQEELSTKAKDAATSLGMMIKPYISNKKDSEINLIINAISDSGFYNEIRLVDAYYTFTKKDVLEKTNLEIPLDAITNITIPSKYGKIDNSDSSALEAELNSLEELDGLEENEIDQDIVYTFYPSKAFKNNDTIEVSYSYMQNGEEKSSYVTLEMTNIIVHKVRDVKFDSIPAWFVNMIDFNIVEEQSEISDNWKVSAIVFVKANPGIAYEKLYEQFQATIVYSLIIFIVFIVVISLFVRLLLKPLKDIEKVTSKIAECEFEKITKIPWTKEFKSVALAINDMSDKLQKIINKLNDNIKVINRRLQEDPLTGLEMKDAFMSDIKGHFFSKREGYAVLLKISELGDFAKKHGRRDVDTFIKKFAEIIKGKDNSKGYRFVGSEFMFVVHSISEEDFKVLMKNLQSKFEELGAEFDKSDVVHMGASKFNRFSTIPSILTSTDESFNMAKIIGDNAFNIKESDTNARGTLEWYKLIDDVIENKTIELNFMFETKSIGTDTTLMYEVFSKVLDEKNEQVPIGPFISLAEEKGQIIEFDKMVLNKTIQHINDNNFDYKIAVNLSMTSMLDLSFVSWLESHFTRNSDLSKKIIFNVSAFSIKDHIEEFKKFIKIVNNLGIDVMIKRYESKFIDSEVLKILRPNIIRLAKNYTDEIATNEDQVILVDSICNITNILNIKVIAECEEDESSVQALTKIGIVGISH